MTQIMRIFADNIYIKIREDPRYLRHPRSKNYFYEDLPYCW